MTKRLCWGGLVSGVLIIAIATTIHLLGAMPKERVLHGIRRTVGDRPEAL